MATVAASARQAPPDVPCERRRAETQSTRAETQSTTDRTQSSLSAPKKADACNGEEDRGPSRTLMFLLCTTALVEGVDDAMLPAVSFALQVDLGLKVSGVTNMAMMQALTMAVFAPMWGIFGDRGVMSRKFLLVAGAIGQGVVTIVLAFASNYYYVLVLRALNGVMLASLRPLAVSMLSEVTSETNRGKSFAWIGFSSMIGMMVGFLLGTPISRVEFLGMHGWRFAFISIGTLSVVVGALVYMLMIEPPRQRAASTRTGIMGALAEEFSKLLYYFTIPSFIALIAQGCIGLVPWKAINYQTLYFQVAGIKDFWAGFLQASNLFASALGNLLGGKIGDSFACRCPNHGRPFTAQISVAGGIPIAALLFMVPPPAGAAFAWYLLLVVSLGLVASWTAAGVNWPILTQIVSPENRGAVMAWETAVEGAFASVVGNMAVGWVSQTLGFDLEEQKEQVQQASDSGRGNNNMFALGFALTMTSVVPWVFCLAFYGMLHWSLQRDLRRVQEDALCACAVESEGASSGEDSSSTSSDGR